MGLRLIDTAFRSVDLKLAELLADLPAKEEEILRAQPNGGATGSRLVEEYEKRLKLLADRCANQCKWYVENSIVQFGASEKWKAKSTKSVEELQNICSNRLPTVCNRIQVSNHAFVAQLKKMLVERGELVQAKLALNLQAQFDEADSARTRKGISAIQKLVYAALGSGATLLITYLKSLF